MRALTLPSTHPHIRPAELSNLLLICWAGPPDQAVVGEFRALVQGMQKRHPEGFGLLHVIDHQSPPAPMEVRRQLVDCQDQVASQLLGAVAAIASPGLAGAMLRGVMTGMIMLARKPYPRRITGTVPEAYAWLQGLGAPRDCSCDELAALVDDRRAAFQSPSATAP